MTLEEAIGVLESINAKTDYLLITDDARSEALDMAISALRAQELKQDVKKSRCTYKPDCPWYDGSKCNSPNDHGYHECDYDRGVFPESYEENVKNSKESSLTQKALDTISRQAAINSACENDAAKRLNDLIFNVNPDEICEQIKSGNLKNWCVIMQTEMGMALIQLPCWEKEDVIPVSYIEDWFRRHYHHTSEPALVSDWRTDNA